MVSWVNYVSPWDTHYQFSIKTVLSKKEPSWGDTRCTDGALRWVAVEVSNTCPYTSIFNFFQDLSLGAGRESLDLNAVA